MKRDPEPCRWYPEYRALVPPRCNCRPCWRRWWDARYDRSVKGRARHAPYNRSVKGRVRYARYKRSVKGRATSVRYNYRNQLFGTFVLDRLQGGRT